MENIVYLGEMQSVQLILKQQVIAGENTTVTAIGHLWIITDIYQANTDYTTVIFNSFPNLFHDSIRKYQTYDVL